MLMCSYHKLLSLSYGIDQISKTQAERNQKFQRDIW